MNERTADVIEHAAAISEQIREGEISAVRVLNAPEQHPGFDGIHCVEEDCGEEIPPERIPWPRPLSATAALWLESYDAWRRARRR